MGVSSRDKLIRGLAYERAIITILKECNENLLTEYNIENNQLKYDAYCEGRLDLSPFELEYVKGEKIAIEIKVGKPNVSHLMVFIKKILEEIDILVLFFSGEGPSKLVEKLKKYKLDERVRIIDKEILKRNAIIKQVLDSFDEYIVKDDNVLIDNHYRTLERVNENLSFALGAGCSINSNICDWNKLSEALGFEFLYSIMDSQNPAFKNLHVTNQLNKMIFDCYEKTSALDALYNCYIKSASQLDYFELIKKILYMSYNSPIDASKPLMNSIKNCISRKKIKEIISFNFDSVLEQNFNSKYKSRPSEISKSETRIDQCTIHHVHGYIPYDYDGKTNVSNLVLTDSEYYDNMMQRNSYSNTIQQKILQDYNVIFVGVSFTDANLKALLRKRMEKPLKNKIFGFLKLPSFEGNENEKKLLENKYKFIQQSILIF